MKGSFSLYAVTIYVYIYIFIDKCTKDFLNPENRRKIRDNMTPGQRIALKELKNLPTTHGVACRYADKAGVTVITDLKDDENRILDTLSDNNHYDILDADITSDTIDIVKEWADKWVNEGSIDDDIVKFVTDIDNTHPGECKPLYKTHKPKPYPIRLLLSGCGTPTSPLAKFVQVGISHITPHLTYQIMDTKEFLKKIWDINQTIGPLPMNAKLVTCDVTALYPNVSNDMGVPAVKKQLDSFPNPSGFSSDAIVEALNIALNNNSSRFTKSNGETVFARPNRGTAMGPSHACDYVDIFMNEIDTKLVNSCPIPLISSLKSDIDPRLNWSRFRDDGFTIIPDGDDITAFSDFLQTLHPPNIRWTYKCGTEVEYLDVLVSLKNGFLETDVFSKNCHSYLPPSSCHPQSVFKGIIKGIGHRLRMICSTDEVLEKRIDEYANYLHLSGWNLPKVKHQLKEATNIDRESILKSTRQKNNNNKKSAWISRHDPRLPNKSNIINANLNLLYSNDKNSLIFPRGSIISANRRRKNLRDIYKPTVPRPRSATTVLKPPGFYTCNKRCDTCAHSRDTKFIQSPWDGRKWYIKQNLTCTSKNVVYVVCCKEHPKAMYVGSSTNLKLRWAGHKSDSKLGYTKKCAVAKHVRAVNHPVDPQANFLEIIAIESVNEENQLLARETWWQCHLGTIFEGLNIRKDLQSMVRFKNRVQF